MWDFQLSTSHGGRSKRSIVTYALAALIAAFLWILFTPHNTFAADAEWKDNVLAYDGKQFSGPFTTTGSTLPGVPAGVSYFTFSTPAQREQVTIIYFDKGADPKTATNAYLVTGTQNSAGTNFTGLSPPQKVTVGTASASSAPTTSSCNVEGGTGWWLCPITNLLASGVDWLYSVISNFFLFNPLVSSNDSGSLYRLWGIVRSFANVAFVIAFLIIIYAQITGGALSNYTIKKTLPRIIVAAILVNISFWICALAVDLSNFLGVSIQNLLVDFRNSINITNDLPSWQDAVAAVLGGGALVVGGISLAVAVGGTAPGLVMLVLAALVPVLFAAFVAVAILAARQALITVFVILSPLAFVANLLPNTEEWFKKWRKSLMSLLLMFPMFSLIFGGSQLAGLVIIQNAKDLTVVLLGMTVQVVPLFITPFLLKLSNGLLGTIAGMANDRSKGVFDRTKNWADARRKMYQQRGFKTDLKKIDPSKGRTAATRGLRRVGRGIQGLGPKSQAQLWNNMALKRDGLTAAYKSEAEAKFAETKGGKMVHAATKDAGLRKHAADAVNDEAYNKMIYGANGGSHTSRQAQWHQTAHLAAGRAKIIEEASTAHAEKELQKQINTRPDLTAAVVSAATDTGLAELHKKQVQAKGAVALKRVIANTSSLQDQVNDTRVLEKQAASYDAITQKTADEQWDIRSQTEGALRTLRLREERSTNSAKQAEAQWAGIVEQIRAQGRDTTVAGLSASDLDLATDIKAIQGNIEVEAKRQESFKIEQQQNLAKMFKEDIGNIREYAGGDTDAGAARVYARAKKEVSSGFMSTVDDLRTVISDYSLPELMRLAQEGKKRIINPDGTVSLEDATEAERMAAYQEVLLTKGNNWSAQKLKDSVAAEGMHYDDTTGKYYNTKADMRAGVNEITDPDEIEQRRDRQQIFVDALKKSKLSIASVSGTDYGDMESGLFTNTTEDAIKRDIKTKKMKTQRWVSSDLDELQRMIQVLRDDGNRAELGNEDNRDSLKSMLDTLGNAFDNPDIYTQIDGRNLELMKVIQKYAENAYESNGAPMTMDEKKSTEQGTATKVPAEYDPDKVYGWDDPKGPDGSW